MEVKPDYGYDTYVGHNKLKDKVLSCSCLFIIARRCKVTLQAHCMLY